METTDEIVFSAGTFLFACGNEEVAKLVYLAGEQVVKADTLPGLPDGGSPPILVSEEFLFPNHPLLPPALATVERSERVFFTLLSFLFLSFTLFREVGIFASISAFGCGNSFTRTLLYFERSINK